MGRSASSGQSPLAQAARLDLLSAEARVQLERCREPDRRLVLELLQDASSGLQRELLGRALAAGHTAAELHAFGDAIRPLSDDEVFAACTVTESRAPRSVTGRLRAEADPLYAFALNGFVLTPQLEDDPGPAFEPPGEARPRPSARPLLAATSPAERRPRSFELESSQARGRRLDRHDLGESEDGFPTVLTAQGRFAEDLINEAVRPLGLAYREQAVDGPRLKLERAVEAAHAALARGYPVPVILGPAVGEFRRYALMMQVSTSGKTRAFQLHDPFSRETVWVNEGDLYSRAELPFSDKSLRRITAVALPRAETQPP